MRRSLALGALLFAAALVAYLPALKGGFVWDDDGHVTRAELRSLQGLARIWTEPAATQQYYPLLHSAFWLEHLAFGDAPFGYHLVNIAMHALVAFLAWRALAKLAVPGALLAAAIFALHPVLVESVAWVSELKNTLSAAFYLAALLAYLCFAPFDVHDAPHAHGAATAVPQRAHSKRFLALSFFLFLCALASKTVTASLPAAILVIAWWKEGLAGVRRRVLPLIPFFIAGAALGLTTAWLEKHVGGAAGASFSLSAVERVLIAGRALWFYLGKLLWPIDLAFIYPRFVIDASDPAQYAFPVAAAALVIALWVMRARLGRAPLAAALLFGGTLLPALGFFDLVPFLYSFVADHFQYLASLAPIALFAAGAERLSARPGGSAKLPGRLAAGALLSVLFGLTTRQAATYTDMETLWRATLSRNPGCAMAWSNLAFLLNEEGRHDEAADAARAAIAADPREAKAFTNLGLACDARGEFAEAIEAYRSALRFDPRLVEAHLDLGNAYGHLGRNAEALESYERALAIDPSRAEAHSFRGNALLALGRSEEALAAYARAQDLAPDYAEAWYNAGVARAARREYPQAIEHYRRAIQLRPEYVEAHYNLGAALLNSGRREEALIEMRAARELDPQGEVGRRAQGYVDALEGQAPR